MRGQRGRLIAWGTAGAGVVVVAIAAPLVYQRIAEEILFQDLTSTDPDAVDTAAVELGKRGSAQTVPYLLRALEVHGSPGSVLEAIEACVRRHPRKALLELEAFIQERDDDVYLTVGRLLQILDPMGTPAWPRFLERLACGEHSFLREEARSLLANSGVPLRDIYGKAFEVGSEGARVEAFRELAYTADDEVLDETFVREALQDPSPAVRVEAASILNEEEMELSEIIPVLIEGLRSGSPAARLKAAETLAEIGPLAEAARKNIIAVLDDSEGDVRLAAAEALLELGGEENRVLPILLEEIAAGEEQHAEGASRLLDPPSPAGLGKRLRECLSDVSRSGSVIHCLWSLHRLGPEAADEQDIIVEALNHPVIGVRIAAFAALQAMGSTARPESVQVLETFLGGRYPEAAWAMAALTAIDPRRKEVLLPEILEGLDGRQDTEVRESTVDALGSLRDLAMDEVPRLMALLLCEGNDAPSRLTATIAGIGIEPRDIFTLLVAMEAGEDGAFIDSFIDDLKVLAELGDPEIVAAAVPALIRALKAKSSSVRLSASHALRSLGPLARDAELALAVATRDRSRYVRNNAIEALSWSPREEDEPPGQRWWLSLRVSRAAEWARFCWMVFPR